MRYFIVIERTFNNWVDASSESEAIKIALDKFENDCQTDIWIESEEEDEQSSFIYTKTNICSNSAAGPYENDFVNGPVNYSENQLLRNS